PIGQAVPVGIDIRGYDPVEGKRTGQAGSADFEFAAGALQMAGNGVPTGRLAGSGGALDLVALPGLGGPSQQQVLSLGSDVADGEDVLRSEGIRPGFAFLQIGAAVAIFVSGSQEDSGTIFRLPYVSEAVPVEIEIGSGDG